MVGDCVNKPREAKSRIVAVQTSFRIHKLQLRQLPNACVRDTHVVSLNLLCSCSIPISGRLVTHYKR